MSKANDESGTSSERLASCIADAIWRGELKPGARLEEQRLAQHYSVSRTPVREALRQLSSSGLIEIRPRRGAIVASITAERLESLFVAMGEIEATCARLAAIQMTPIERRRLISQHDGMSDLVERDDREGFVAANLQLHSLIYSGCHNEHLETMARSLRSRLAPFRRAQFQNDGKVPKSHAEHFEIVKAISDGNAAAAHAAMLDHITFVEEAFETLLSHVSEVAAGWRG